MDTPQIFAINMTMPQHETGELASDNDLSQINSQISAHSEDIKYNDIKQTNPSPTNRMIKWNLEFSSEMFGSSFSFSTNNDHSHIKAQRFTVMNKAFVFRPRRTDIFDKRFFHTNLKCWGSGGGCPHWGGREGRGWSDLCWTRLNNTRSTFKNLCVFALNVSSNHFGFVNGGRPFGHHRPSEHSHQTCEIYTNLIQSEQNESLYTLSDPTRIVFVLSVALLCNRFRWISDCPRASNVDIVILVNSNVPGWSNIFIHWKKNSQYDIPKLKKNVPIPLSMFAPSNPLNIREIFHPFSSMISDQAYD